MCVDPFTAAAIASVALSAGASAYGGIQTNRAERYAGAVADQNAEIARKNSAITMEQGEEEQRRQYQRTAALRGQQIAAFASQGFDVSFGSPADIITDTAVLGEADAGRLREASTARVNSFLVEASNYRAEAEGHRQAGTTALVTGFLKAGATALGGADTIMSPGAGGSPGSSRPSTRVG